MTGKDDPDDPRFGETAQASSRPGPREPPRDVLTAGALIASRYRLERKLGEGGMGVVWEAVHTVTRRPVALKFVKASGDALVAQARFLREARATSAIEHPGIVPIHDVLQVESGTLCMVMDLLRGESLASKLDREGALSVAETARILVQVGSAERHRLIDQCLAGAPDHVWCQTHKFQELIAGPDCSALESYARELVANSPSMILEHAPEPLAPERNLTPRRGTLRPLSPLRLRLTLGLISSRTLGESPPRRPALHPHAPPAPAPLPTEPGEQRHLAVGDREHRRERFGAGVSCEHRVRPGLTDRRTRPRDSRGGPGSGCVTGCGSRGTGNDGRRCGRGLRAGAGIGDCGATAAIPR